MEAGSRASVPMVRYRRLGFFFFYSHEEIENFCIGGEPADVIII
jgi:hypothetical protein